MFGENHAHIFMNGINYKAAVNRHKSGVDTEVIHEHFRAYQEKGILFILLHPTRFGQGRMN